jgi:hypothetical protein
MAVATTIWRQIRAELSLNKIMSWGLSKRIATEYNGMPALQMRVTGLLHKGWVYVCLNYGNDVYEVYFVNTRGAVKRHLDEVYCDNLGFVLDTNIERGTFAADEYARLAAADTARKMNA